MPYDAHAGSISFGGYAQKNGISKAGLHELKRGIAIGQGNMNRFAAFALDSKRLQSVF